MGQHARQMILIAFTFSLLMIVAAFGASFLWKEHSIPFRGFETPEADLSRSTADRG